MDTVVITGGAGFVGSSLALGIRKRRPGTIVLVIDNLKRRGSELNLPRLREAGVKFIHGDIRNPEDFDIVGGADLIIECSAEPSVLAGYNGSPSYVINTNLTGTIACIEFARKCKAGLIFLSTSRVYPIATLNSLEYVEEDTRFVLLPDQPFPGASEHGIAENFPLTGTRSMYGATKLCSEMILHEFMQMYGLKGIINRCGVISGPWQMGKVDQGVIVHWVARHLYGGPLQYIGYGGYGKQVRDVLHVTDLLELILHQIEHLDELNGQTFNVGGSEINSISLQELTYFCQEITGKSIDIGRESADRPADVRIYITDNSKVTSATGWRPKKDIRTVVDDICRWLTLHSEDLNHII